MTIDRVVALYETWGRHTYDEELTQLDHGLQTAALAAADGADEALVVAALLHDVGHLLALERGDRGPAPDEDLHHEAVGAKFLGDVFGPEVTAPIALHVRAKRYRCAVDPEYHEGLSDGSRASLVRQGGPLSAEEAAAFERVPGFADAVALRGWDDGGKVDGLEVPGFGAYLPLLERVRARPEGGRR